MTKCECCEMRAADRYCMELGEWLCSDCMDQAVAEDSAGSESDDGEESR